MIFNLVQKNKITFRISESSPSVQTSQFTTSLPHSNSSNQTSNKSSSSGLGSSFQPTLFSSLPFEHAFPLKPHSQAVSILPFQVSPGHALPPSMLSGSTQVLALPPPQYSDHQTQHPLNKCWTSLSAPWRVSQVKKNRSTFNVCLKQ